ncbi:hypothetical protein ZIOFF_031949 [Zingiber officinale]|uniref:Retrovirus-related Pol polyprotein from transposon TNT 1-94-like beta-barrel domain-containing protein n=1 Tax=Zingiber officinale TaxID=94328 RepID=A0A8J5G9U2_ZINOF|nr:hypothetical protein ZIOFF_035537 [Zingiber officinale]KAG6506622.1 hypothetical protein ZIOFF_031949 [Zingiber officinale]
MKAFASLREVFSEVRREEARRYVMLKNIPESKPEMEGSALAVRGAEFEGNRQGKQRPWCDYCRKPWHTRENCWKLHGKPAYGKRKQGSDNKLGGAHESIVPIGTLACTKSNGFWILDSGATDHMTGISQYFSSYTPSAGNQKIKIAYGSFATVAGKGLVPISQSITLKDVLHVPTLSCNLLSISKFTHDHNCRANFCSSHCEFQDLTSGKMIGDAKQDGGLYLFNEGIQEARNVPEWREAILEEMKDLEKNSTREKVDFPNGKTIVGPEGHMGVAVQNAGGALSSLCPSVPTLLFSSSKPRHASFIPAVP